MRSVKKKLMLISYYVIQLIIFGLCFLAFTSTMEVFPWYEPLTMGPFIILMSFALFQVFVSLIIRSFRRNSLIYNKSNIISNINSGILLFITVIPMINESLFYPLAIICAFAECLLAVSFVITIIKPTVRIKK